MNNINFIGHVGADAEVRTAGNGEVCNFNVAVKQGIGRDAPTEWYRVEVWGKRGVTLAQYVKKGSKVAVAGEFIIDEYQGKKQFKVRAHEVDPFCGGRGEQASGAPSRADLDDDSDSIPF